GEIGDDVDRRGTNELGEEGDTFRRRFDVNVPGGSDRTALENVHKGQNGAGDVDDNQRGPRGVAKDNLRVLGEAEVKYQNARFGGHEGRVLDCTLAGPRRRHNGCSSMPANA